MTPQQSAALPRTLRLPPHRSLLHRGPSARLIGLDPRTALAVDDLPPPLARMLDELAAPTDRAGLVARAVRRGADVGAAEDLLRRLLDADALVDADGPERVAGNRAAAVVAVVGEDRLAAGVAAGLALAGVGTVHVSGVNGGVVQANDLGTGLLDADRGRPRADAVADAVRRVAPRARVGPTPTRPLPDLCVLADVAAPDPVRVAALHRDVVAHLPVRLRDGTGVVGPLVLPGRSACLGCVELHRSDRDPGWPTVAAQLVDRPGRGTPATAAATAALGVAQVLAALDGAAGGAGFDGGAAPGPPALGATLELDVAAGVLLRRPWAAHPSCTCGAPPRETGGEHGGQGQSWGE
jgi:bacteriocin biosynthesis cyclodehydratase domain-containing protein